MPKDKGAATTYLLFCDKCGQPQEIPNYILRTYFTLKSVNVVYCEHCENKTDIPEYLKEIAQDL